MLPYPYDTISIIYHSNVLQGHLYEPSFFPTKPHKQEDYLLLSIANQRKIRDLSKYHRAEGKYFLKGHALLQMISKCS